uniref:Major facilitator superfamily associated domain-containing protein n=1 Tax=Glossina austeni TaxID=7395 RepID=A0A1A9UDM0_GLOAU
MAALISSPLPSSLLHNSVFLLPKRLLFLWAGFISATPLIRNIKKLRKLRFIGLIFAIPLAYAAFYFIPQIHNAPICLDDVWNVTLNRQLIPDCNEQLLSVSYYFCRSGRVMALHVAATDIVHKLNIEQRNLSLETFLISNLHDFAMDLCITSILTSPFQRITAKQIIIAIIIRTVIDISDLLVTAYVYIIQLNVTNSISDAIRFDMLGKTEETKYGAQRVWGAIGLKLVLFPYRNVDDVLKVIYSIVEKNGVLFKACACGSK